jgi:hypothetical protein
MRLVTLNHQPASGWSRPMPVELDGPSTWVLVFGAPDALRADAPVRQALADVARAFPRSVLQGCSSAGEIFGAQVLDDALAVAVVHFEHSRLHLACAPLPMARDSAAAGAALAHALPRDGLRAVFLLCDGLSVNGTALVAALAEHLPPGVPITGGLAGDGASFTRTWVLADGEPQAGRVSALGLYGERVVVGHGCDGGWSDFGPERLITRSEGNVLYELDGQPALDLYKSYLGERASGLPATALLFPLAVRRPQGDGEPLVRTVLSVDERKRSVTFAGDMPQGGVARLMRSNTERLIDSAGSAAGAALGGRPEGEALVVSISCVGRRLLLGERTEEEVESVLDAAPAGYQQVGF